MRENKKRPFGRFYGGERGIRTPDTLRYTRFPSVRAKPATRPLHLSGAYYTITPHLIQAIFPAISR
jgi:hypothetical protein